MTENRKKLNGIIKYIALLTVMAVAGAIATPAGRVFSESPGETVEETVIPVTAEETSGPETPEPADTNPPSPEETEITTPSETGDPAAEATEGPAVTGTAETAAETATEPTSETATEDVGETATPERPTEEPTLLPEIADDGTPYLKCFQNDTVSLSGKWAAEVRSFDQYNEYKGEPVAIGAEFEVPGIGYNGCEGLLLERNFYLAGFDPGTSAVFLKACRLFYGAKVFVNGKQAGAFEFSYIEEAADITAFVNEGKNTLRIILKSGAESVYGAGPGLGIDGPVILESRQSYSVDSITVDSADRSGSIVMRVGISFRPGVAVKDNVTVNVYERGIFADGKYSTNSGVGTDTVAFVSDGSGGRLEAVLTVNLRGFDDSKLWSPDNPFLFEARFTAGGLSETVLFGVRTAEVREDDVYLTLNGNRVFLSGVTIDGELRDRLALYGETRIRSYVQYLKSLGMNTLKGKGLVFSRQWYKICDEEGLFLISEYPLGTISGGKKGPEDAGIFAEDIAAAAGEGFSCASCIVWDLAGEDYPVTGLESAIALIKGMGQGERPFSTGLSRPADPSYIVECDVSYLGGSVFMEDLSAENPLLHTGKNISWNIKNVPAARIITMMCGKILYRGAEVDHLGESGGWWKEVMEAYGDDAGESFSRVITELIEYWRTSRKYGGIILPCEVVEAGLAGTGVKFREDLEKALKSGFYGIGVNIETHISTGGRGEVFAVDVAVTNNFDVDLDVVEVVFTLTAGQKVIFQETKQYDSLKKLGTEGRDVERRKFTFEVPKSVKDGEELVLSASVPAGDVTVSSRRTAVIEGGSTYESAYSGTAVAIAVSSAGAMILIAAAAALIRIRAFNSKQKRQEKK